MTRAVEVAVQSRDPAAEEAVIRASNLRLLHSGRMLTVTAMFDGLGVPTPNPLHAYACMCYDPISEKWLAVQCLPGEVAPFKDARYAVIFTPREG